VGAGGTSTVHHAARVRVSDKDKDAGLEASGGCDDSCMTCPPCHPGQDQQPLPPRQTRVIQETSQALDTPPPMAEQGPPPMRAAEPIPYPHEEGPGFFSDKNSLIGLGIGALGGGLLGYMLGKHNGYENGYSSAYSQMMYGQGGIYGGSGMPWWMQNSATMGLPSAYRAPFGPGMGGGMMGGGMMGGGMMGGGMMAGGYGAPIARPYPGPGAGYGYSGGGGYGLGNYGYGYSSNIYNTPVGGGVVNGVLPTMPSVIQPTR
jgi:hypothetical protein